MHGPIEISRRPTPNGHKVIAWRWMAGRTTAAFDIDAVPSVKARRAQVETRARK